MKWTPVVTLALAASLAVLSGCSEEEPTPSPSAAPEETLDEQRHEAMLGRTRGWPVPRWTDRPETLPATTSSTFDVPVAESQALVRTVD